MTGRLTALEAAQRIGDGSLTSEALVRACLDRIGEREPLVQAWQHLDMDAALKMARHLDQFGSGPLKGIPVGVKDIIDTADMPTGYGSSLYETFRPPRDAACVTLARHAGALILGKTVTTEFAYFQPGKTRNPHDPTGHPAAPPQAPQRRWPVAWYHWPSARRRPGPLSGRPASAAASATSRPLA